MSDNFDAANSFSPTPTPPRRSVDHFSRRTLMASVIGGISAAALASRFAGLLRQPTTPGIAQTSSTGPASIGVASPSPVANTATIAPSPTSPPSPTPVPNPFGQIDVFRGEQWAYAGEPLSSDTLALFVQGNDRNLDFSPASYVQDTQIITSYLDPLVGIDKITMEPIPWLADKWEWGDGNQSVTYTLRGDVTWHDGSPLTADDVAFSFIVYRDDIESAVRNFFTTLDSVDILDDRTLRVNLTTPDGNWLLNASSLPIFSRRQYADYWNGQPEGARSLSGFDWNDSLPLGTGPWKIDEQRSGAIVMTSNRDWWQTPPHFEKLILNFSDSQDERIGRWNDGEGDLLWPISPLDIPALKDTAGHLYASHGAQVAFAAFNFENLGREQYPQLLAEPRVRQALNLAIDRNKYADDIWLDLIDRDAAGTVAQPWANDPSVTNPPRDVDKARQLLKDAGFLDPGNGQLNDPTGIPFELDAIVRNDANPGLIAILENLVEDLAEIGVSLIVNQLSPTEFFDRWAYSRNWDLIAYSYALYPGFTDYDLYGSNWDIRINPQGWNPGGYDNDDVDNLLKKILISPNLDSQATALSRLQEITNGDDLFALWFGFPNDLIMTRTDIQGFQPGKYVPIVDTSLLWRDQTGSEPLDPTTMATPDASPIAIASASPMIGTPKPVISPSAGT